MGDQDMPAKAAADEASLQDWAEHVLEGARARPSRYRAGRGAASQLRPRL